MAIDFSRFRFWKTMMFHLHGRQLLVFFLLVALCSPTIGAESQDPVYLLSPYDKIKISVYGEPDLSTEQLITDNGMVFIPLVGPLKLGGQTIASASEMITRAFVSQEYLRKPMVTISVEEFSPKVLTVLGEVRKPGSIEISPGRNGLPIEIAIAQAGGFTGTAKTTAVMLTRAEKNLTNRQVVVVNVEKILRSDESDSRKNKRVVVFPDDVVFVPRRVF